MRLVDSSYGAYGEHSAARRRAIGEKRFRYLVLTAHGGNPKMIGGSSTMEIRGTNNIKELLKPSMLGTDAEFIDTKTGKSMNKTTLGKQYLASLTQAEKKKLLDRMILAFVLGD
ncbi:MAG: hypothetical protein AAB850_02640 [Patescibacteria group bacterium]